LDLFTVVRSKKIYIPFAERLHFSLDSTKGSAASIDFRTSPLDTRESLNYLPTNAVIHTNRIEQRERRGRNAVHWSRPDIFEKELKWNL
jgi:hypothetical protein